MTPLWLIQAEAADWPEAAAPVDSSRCRSALHTPCHSIWFFEGEHTAQSTQEVALRNVPLTTFFLATPVHQLRKL